jgi:phospholipase/carboxylesterase
MPGIADIVHRGAGLAEAQAVCVLVHGRNQDPEEMEAHVIRRVSAPGIAWALPRAEERSWYRALAVDALTAATRDELALSLTGIGRLVEALRAEAPGRPLCLAGFSQGACLALEHSFAGVAPPDAVVALTGCRVGRAGDARPSALPAGLPVYLTGGEADPWIPVAAMAEALAELGRAGAALRADVFPGRPHEVSDPEIAMFETILADLCQGHPPRMGAQR